MQLCVDGKGRGVERALALYHVSIEIHQQQVRGANAVPGDAERVCPEAVLALGVAHGDVPRHPVVVPKLREDAACPCEPRLAMGALLGQVGEGGRLQVRVRPLVELPPVQHATRHGLLPMLR